MTDSGHSAASGLSFTSKNRRPSGFGRHEREAIDFVRQRMADVAAVQAVLTEPGGRSSG